MQTTPIKLSKGFDRLIIAVVLLLIPTLQRGAEEPQIDPTELPRIPATAPEKALETFELRPGIALDLAAHEPLVEDPVSIAFDEDGRLFAVEMRGYSERRDDARGQIRLLFDDDDDGFFDRSTIFAKDLKWPTGLVCSKGGIYVVATPDLIWFKDTDGDGIAEERKVIFTGFGEGTSKLNVQGLPNSLKWGPDNRIWGSGGTLGGKIRQPDQAPGEAISISGADFSFDPKTLDFRAENGRAQYGLSFDSSGRRFVSSNSVHIMGVMWERNWTTPSPWYSLPTPLASIATDGGAAPVFRISPDEPWRIVRTRWRVAGVVKGVVEGGGRVSGYFTGASGITIYTGDMLGPEFVDNAFTGDVGSNLVHRKIVSHLENKVALQANRAKDEGDREFIASTDNWFRPTTYANAPDGCFYISDMYREVIEHPWSLPEGIKKHLDLNSGTDRGRIYRVRPEDWKRRPTQKLSEFSNTQLVALLSHPNGWHRTSAQRLLWERDDPGAGEGWAKVPDSPFRKALLLAGTKSQHKTKQLAEFLTDSPDDTWLTSAVIHALKDPVEAADLFYRLSEDGLEKKPYLFPLAGVIGKMNDPEANETVLATAAKYADRPEAVPLLEAIGVGLASSKNSLAKADQSGKLEPVFRSALATAADDGVPAVKRISAIQLLSFSPDKAADNALESILTSPGKEKYYLASMQSLKKRGSKSLPELLINNWANYSDSVRSAALGILLENPSSTQLLLAAIEKDSVAKSVLNATHIDLLRDSKTPAIKKTIDKLYPIQKMKPRSEVVASYGEVLKLKGDPEKGFEIFKTACVSCHKHGEIGHTVGPDLATFKTAGSDSIISNLFDPNKEVAPQYQTYLFTLKNGEQTMGIIGRETTTDVTVKMAFGIEKTFPRTEVSSMKALGKSLMPEGLESVLPEQSVADLLAFIAKG